MGVWFTVLRTIHIVGGIFWAGGSWVLYGFVFPSVVSTQPESGRFMQVLAGRSGLPIAINVAAVASVLAGIAIYVPASGHFDPGWMASPRGVTLSVGAAIALLVAIEGQIVLSPTARRMGTIGRAVATSGWPPTSEQWQQFAALQAKLIRTGRRGALLLVVATLLMAVSRYL